MKNKFCLISLFVLIQCVALGQTADISGVYENQPIIEVLNEIEQSEGVEFFYHEGWLDTLAYSGRFENEPLESVLSMLFDQTPILYYIEGSKIYLTNNKKIISELRITSFFDRTSKENEVEKGLIFDRELSREQSGQDAESRIFEIGQVNLMKRGENVTMAGFIKESASGNPVEGALVYIQNPFIGTTTDTEGFYSLTIPNGKQVVQYQSLNMKNTTRTVVLYSDGRLDVDMEIDVIALKTVVVDAERDVNVTNPTMGVTRIDVRESKNVPVLMGERDIVKIATTTSGVQSIGEGAAGVNVRGGKADQNLFLLDGTPIYNTSHFFGFFSVFNADMTGSMDIYKSSIPAQYGGRLSSVFDIETKVPDTEELKGEGGIGPVTSRLMVEFPLLKGKTSAMIGGRATYSDFILNRLENSPLGNNDVRFYDFNGKIYHRFSDKSQLSISGYHSFDGFQLAADSLLSYTDFSYQNTNLSVIWDHRFSDEFSSRYTLGMSRYDYGIGYDVLPSQAFEIAFDLDETLAKADFQFQRREDLGYSFGVNVSRFDLQPGNRMALTSESLITPDQIEKEQGFETGIYFSAQYDPSDRLSLSGGLRYATFNVLGPRSSFVYDEGKNNRIDTLSYTKGQTIDFYHGPEWRISGRYTLDPTTSLKASINRNRQNVHLLINAASIAPTDIWRLTSEHIRPQIADQFSIGVYKNFERTNIIETSAEIYYKKIQNLIDFKVGADLQFNKFVETDILQGPGRSYGVELTVRKNSGWFTGWLNYTYSRSLIRLSGDTFEETVNRGEYFPTNYDKPHYINLVTNYKFTRRLSLSINSIYSTGRPSTYPVGKWSYRGVENIHYSDRNEFRLPDYFRMDIGVNLEGNHKVKKLAKAFWSFSLYNALGRNNVYSVFFNVDEGEVSGYQMSVFPDPIPTITYNFSF
jgi:hypothetical protein